MCICVQQLGGALEKVREGHGGRGDISNLKQLEVALEVDEEEPKLAELDLRVVGLGDATSPLWAGGDGLAGIGVLGRVECTLDRRRDRTVQGYTRARLEAVRDGHRKERELRRCEEV